MNKDDITQLQSLLNMNTEEFEEWLTTANSQDLFRVQQILDEFSIASIDFIVARGDLSLAKNYLQKFTG